MVQGFHKLGAGFVHVNRLLVDLHHALRHVMLEVDFAQPADLEDVLPLRDAPLIAELLRDFVSPVWLPQDDAVGVQERV